MTGKETGWLGNKRTSGDHPYYSIGPDNEKSPRRLEKTCCHSNFRERLVWQTLKGIIIIIIMIIIIMIIIIQSYKHTNIEISFLTVCRIRMNKPKWQLEYTGFRLCSEINSFDLILILFNSGIYGSIEHCLRK